MNVKMSNWKSHLKLNDILKVWYLSLFSSSHYQPYLQLQSHINFKFFQNGNSTMKYQLSLMNLPIRPFWSSILFCVNMASKETTWNTLFTVLFVPTMWMYRTTRGSKYKYCHERQKNRVCSITRTQSFWSTDTSM